MTTPTNLPIGVFDSGIGGLTVVRALAARLPHEHILYFGDTARVPYGVKSVETIARYATQITEFLLEQQVKLLIVACNTMAACAAQAIRDLSPVPVLDVIDAGARAAVGATRRARVGELADGPSVARSPRLGPIGVIGTLATIGSAAYERAIHAHDASIQVRSAACPLLVPLVEEGWLDHPVTRLTAQEYLAPLLQDDIDTLVLGCTHYPLLKAVLAEVAGADVQLVDSAETVAAQTAALLARQGLANAGPASGNYRFFVTDVPQRFQQIGERFLGHPLTHVHVVKW